MVETHFSVKLGTQAELYHSTVNGQLGRSVYRTYGIYPTVDWSSVYGKNNFWVKIFFGQNNFWVQKFFKCKKNFVQKLI